MILAAHYPSFPNSIIDEKLEGGNPQFSLVLGLTKRVSVHFGQPRKNTLGGK